MSYWTEDEPGLGDLECLGAAERSLKSVKSQLASLNTAATTCANQVTASVWSGQAGDAWRESFAPPRNTVTTLQTAIQSACEALRTYASTVNDIAYQATYLRHNLVEAQQALTGISALLLPYGTTIDDDTFVSRNVRTAYEERSEQVAMAERALQELAEERRTADATFCAAMDRAAGPQWAATRKALASVGITSVTQLTPDQLAEAFATIAQRIARGSHVDTHDAESLRAFLTTYGNDQNTMSKFAWDVGGGDYVSAINKLGLGVDSGNVSPALALGLAQAMRHALSVGSRDWEAGAARQFARSMLANPTTLARGVGSAIGFLFSDSDRNPVGENLTVAMADAIDKAERGTGSGHRNPWIDLSPLSGGAVLAGLEGKVTGLSPARTRDYPGRILQTLGQYPDSALKWLSDPGKESAGSTNTKGHNRIRYWFGERNWGSDITGDGWEAPAALWAGAQKATGGPLDAQQYDKNAWHASADTTGRIINALGGNDAFSPAHMSEIAKVRLAGAIAADIPQFTEYPISQHAAGSQRTSVPALFPGMDGMQFLPNPRRDALALVTAAAMTSVNGNALITNSAHGAQDHLVQMAAGGIGGLTHDQALDRTSALQGYLDGVSNGVKLSEAHARDAAVQNTVSAATSALEAVPVFGTGIKAADWLGTLSASTATGGGASWATDHFHWADDYKNELAHQEASRAGQERALAKTLEEYRKRLPKADPVDSYMGQYRSAADDFSGKAEGGK